MDKQQLQTKLTALHQELSTIDNVDEATKSMLATVMADMAKLLADNNDDDDSDPVAKGDGAGEQHVRSLITELEAEHPKVARVLGQLADGLANLGI